MRFHCSGVGSTPVGLCAHACRTMIDPDAAASKEDNIPSISRPLVWAEKYGYFAIERPTFVKIWLWFAQVGSLR